MRLGGIGGAVSAVLALTACSPSASEGEPPPTSRAGQAEIVAEGPARPETDRGDDRTSQFTRIDDKACTEVSTDAETGDWTGRCPGVAGMSLEWSIGDLRDDLAVIDGGRRSQLHIPSLVAKGAFDSLGKTAEWRGRRGSEPDVLVVRVHVADSTGKSDSGSLALARLDRAPCLVAVVPPGGGQSEKARAIADGKLPACLKN